MISMKHKFIYLHPAKTAGTSIELALADYSEDRISRRVTGDVTVFHGKRNVKHADLAVVRRILGEQLDGFYIFMSIRNPWDRVVSYHHYARPHWSMRRLLQSSIFRQAYVSYMKPAADFIRVSDPPLVHLIRFENLEEEFARTCREIGIVWKGLLQHALYRPRGHYSGFYDAALRERVRKLYERDIEMFGYEFQQEG